MFQVSVGDAEQLVLTLNGAELDYTVVGREAVQQIVGMAMVTTTEADSILYVAILANGTPLTITPNAGTFPVSAHLVIAG